MRDLQIKVTHFDAEPEIRNDRFQFSSFDFAEGTVVEDGLVLGNRAASVGLPEREVEQWLRPWSTIHNGQRRAAILPNQCRFEAGTDID